MRRYSIHTIWFTALLLISITTGCGDPDKNAIPTPPTTPPTVTLVTPANGNSGLCSTTAIISATFSKAMNPATITTSTFTVTAPGGASVAGTVSYAAATNIATFTPSSALALNTAYTATITTGAADTFGNRLEANFVWTFTTGAACPPPPAVFSLGTACSFGILGSHAISYQRRPNHCHRRYWDLAGGFHRGLPSRNTHRHKTCRRCRCPDRSR